MTGQTLAHYQILEKLGEGGMGEVYRARDTKLGRDVAVKVLPAAFAGDVDRMARFQREAQVLASLNHPNIASIYGVEERALVMELVAGPTLAERIAVGPMPLDEALPIAKQIAEAFEAAHEKGIIHRDLKPANVKVKPDGAVKVLDFGLAKALDDDPSASDLRNSPTISLAATRAGVILGTAAYMSPEQAKGKPVDRRADIWAFGIVLLEMLTGRQVYGGETAAETLASVMLKDPSFDALPADTPAAIRKLLRRCLDKDPKHRLRDIGEARIAIEEALSGAPAEAAPALPVAKSPRRDLLPWAVAALATVAAVAFAIVHFRETPERAQTIRFQVAQPEKMVSRFSDHPVISPDGQRIVFGGAMPGAGDGLWVRPLNAVAAQPLPGTAGARFPFWSPDGRFLAFFGEDKLQKLDLSGGPPQTLCAVSIGGGGTWSRRGGILFADGLAGARIRAVPATGGEPQTVAAPDTSRGEQGYHWPRFLPDGRHFLFFVSGTPDLRGIYLGSLDSKDKRRVAAADAGAAFAPPDHLLFPRGSTLMAQPFDIHSFQVAGEPVRVVEQVAMLPFFFGPAASVSENGTLAYLDGEVGATSQLVWFDREGKRLGNVGQPDVYSNPSLSPDETKLAVGRVDPNAKTRDIWVFDLTRGSMTRLTFDPADDMNPTWSPDGRRIAFSSNRKGSRDLYWKAADGSGDEEVLLESKEDKSAEAWSVDGKLLVFNRLYREIWTLQLQPEKKAAPVLAGPFTKSQGHLSPNGRWIAYRSNESGRDEIFVQTFPPGSGKWPISTAGGSEPQWRRDGRELFYMAEGKLMSAETKTEAGVFEAGVPKVVFETPRLGVIQRNRYVVSPDGKRFLLIVPVEATSARPFTVVAHWDAEVRP